ncbi:methionyl-tRNA formyltransferase [Rhodobacteraceae bacterium 63075]|nr:methionyl-tRNA formyltransferase [Rhodobacteraceae bacterium 63075]
MRVIFMGSPEFSLPALDAILAAGHEVVAVYCQPPRASGRGKKERPTPVQARAEELGLPVRHPKSLRTAEAQAEFASFDADVAVVVAYGLILPKEILYTPAYGCINIHASLLPRWRGAAPIHRAIMAGDEQTGVCIMQMDDGLDTGPVLLRRKVPIEAGETTQSLHSTLAYAGGELIAETLENIGEITPKPQPSEGITYAEKIDKSESRIDWTRPSTEIDRKIRGLSPFPGAWCEHEGIRVKLLLSAPAIGSGFPGEVIDTPAYVACGQGAVELKRLQKAGGKAQDADDFVKGTPLPLGTCLT